MKVQLKDLLMSSQILNEFVGQKMNGVLGFKLFEILREVEPKLKTLEEARIKLLNDNGGKLDTDTDKYKF